MAPLGVELRTLGAPAQASISVRAKLFVPTDFNMLFYPNFPLKTDFLRGAPLAPLIRLYCFCFARRLLILYHCLWQKRNIIDQYLKKLGACIKGQKY